MATLQDILVTGVGQAGNWIALIERIKAELNRDRQDEEDLIKRAAITALQHYRWHRFHFNEGSSSMLTTPGVTEYGPESSKGAADGYPIDMLDIDQIQAFQNVESLGGNNWAYPMERTHIDRMRLLIESTHSGNKPYWYAWHHQSLFIFPGSTGGQHRLLFDYMADLDFPRYQFVSGEWLYFDREGSPITDDYSTPWLEHAEELIRNRAKADLWANVFYDTEKAQLCRGQENEALKTLRIGKHKQLSTGSVRPHFGGSLGAWYT